MSALVRYESPVLSFPSLLDELLDNSFFNLSGREITGTSWPRVDIAEHEHEYALRADLPGLARDDIKITVENDVLTISGEKKEERHEEKKGNFYHYERSFGRFSRSFTLPEHVDRNSITANYANGVLSLTIKKTAEAAPKAIEVKVN